MADWQSQLIIKMRNEGAKFNSPDLDIATVKSLEPFILDYNGIDIGYTFGDTVFMDNLRLDANIELDLESLSQPQSFSDSTAYQSPSFTASVSGSQLDFLTGFYNFFQNFQKRYIIEVGDLVAIQKLKSNTYYIIEKVQRIEQ